ncbi:uncharacterized protein LOC132171289 [Corylus avellana]|uniref:uncharacterized protein LOC132171289 n=1 Tax=Corylus avellana TaxID=13451 RepID=UPI00286CB87C|nr:uncharacterized protein LOC132171289 [Corylus avellana]
MEASPKSSFIGGKYYPGGSFLESGLGHRPSFAWRNIWNAKSLLNRGLIWWVGNGSSIKIWHDRWVPVPSTYAIQSPMRILDSEETVDALIDEETQWCNTPLIHEIFSRDEAAMICSIPICPGRQRDRLAWMGTKNGEFSFKSAYHLAKDICEGSRGSCSESSLVTHQWKNVWHTAGPMAVKTFLWQASNEILATRVNLDKKGITYDPLCPICGLASETVVHILWTCPSANDVWIECMKSIYKSSLKEDTFLNVLEMLQRRLDDEGMQLVAVVEQLESFRIAELGRCVHGSPSPPLPNPVMQSWKKPPYGVINLNWDSAIDKEGQKMGIGIIARDHNGDIYAAFVVSRQYIIDPTTDEALAAWKMAQLYVPMGLNDVMLEGDSLEVVQALCEEESTWGRYGALITDAKFLLQNIQRWSVCHVKMRQMKQHIDLRKWLFLLVRREYGERITLCVSMIL